MDGSALLSLPLVWFECKVPGSKCQVLAYRYCCTIRRWLIPPITLMNLLEEVNRR
jgi:hypothetical protein